MRARFAEARCTSVVRLLLRVPGMSSVERPSRRRRSAGSTFVEAAIAIPLLVVLILSTVDLGILVGIELALQNAVSQASRYGATGRSRTGATRQDSIITELQNAAPSVTIAAGDVKFTNLTKAGVVGPGGPTDVVMMSVKHDWKLVSPLLKFFFTGGIATIQVSATVANEPFPTS
jgi:Flp pilus assembly protein TadG